MINEQVTPEDFYLRVRTMMAIMLLSYFVV